MHRSAITVLAAAAAALPLAGCGESHTTTTRHATVPEPARCIPAVIHNGAPPSWTTPAWADSSPGFRVPYSLASGDTAAAFFFAPRLRAGHPENPSNKVLWVVRFPRDGHPLDITARLGRDTAEVVRSTWSADSEPGEIYPSGIDLPKPGCWHLALAWGRHRASVDVEVHPAAHS
ncbi:MAG TPA: hypothetical protein VFH80_08495 [Solirubrobacteraceae bacterium]|nr:hypothetical protein [Solirubrobacteraceae bacterium]